MLRNSEPFESHTNNALRFSHIGFDIVSNYNGDWFKYKKSKKPKRDYVKIISAIIAFLSLCWNIYQGISNSELKEKNDNLENIIDSLQERNGINMQK
ncbi:MAG: hypothetical protein R2831_10640 [Chitinophagaceae bacterium]